MMSKQPGDISQRQQALDPDVSIICEAPAGSGKTELLIQRMLTLLARVNTPEEIIAITFTRKAAGEMRERVLAALQFALQSEAPESDHQKLTWQLARNVLNIDTQYSWSLIENPNRLCILTFDSLCAKLANTLPLHSSFAAAPRVNEQPELLYRWATRAMLETLEEDVPWADALAQVLKQLDNNMQRLEDLLVNILAKRESWLPLLGSGAEQAAAIEKLEKNLLQVRKDTITKLTRAIPLEYHRILIELAVYAASHLRSMGQDSPLLFCLNMDSSVLPGDDEEGIKQWLGLATVLLTDGDLWRKTLNVKVGFPPGENVQEKTAFRAKKAQCLELIDALKEEQALLELLVDLRKLPSSTYDKEQKQILAALIQVLPVLSAHLTLIFREKNCVDYSEISIKARMALGEASNHTELAMRLDYHIQHILVDEFQDTSPSQVELLTQLTLGWVPGDGRTLFCVGDAMQSIYGFRGANVGLFIYCIAHGLGHIPLKSIQLTTNFRSQEALVSWINSVFSRAFPKRNDISDGAVIFSPSDAFNESLPEPAVNVHGFKEDTAESEEAQVIVEIIKNTRLQSPDSTIAILVRNRSHAMHIMPVLKDAGLYYRAVDMEALQDRMLIQDLLSLCHALLQPADRIAWLAVLRAPWCGLSLFDLEVIANSYDERLLHLPTLLQQIQWNVSLETAQANSNISFDAEKRQYDMFATDIGSSEPSDKNRLSDDGRARLTRVAHVLTDTYSQQQRKSLRQWVEGTWIALGGPACLYSQEEVNNAELFFNMLEDIDENTMSSKKRR